VSASDHLSPDQLRAHVKAHLNKWSETYHTPECADGLCWHATRAYIHRAVEDGHEAHYKTFDLDHDEPVPPNPGYRHGTHTVAGVQTSRGPYIVDLTHRQFDAKSPYPVIEPEHRFMSRDIMKPFKYVEEYDIDTGEGYWEGFDEFPHPSDGSSRDLREEPF